LRGRFVIVLCRWRAKLLLTPGGDFSTSLQGLSLNKVYVRISTPHLFRLIRPV